MGTGYGGSDFADSETESEMEEEKNSLHEQSTNVFRWLLLEMTTRGGLAAGGRDLNERFAAG